MRRLAPLAALALAFAIGACKGSLLNPYRKECRITSIDSFPVFWPSGDTTMAVLVTTWCEWRLEDGTLVEGLLVADTTQRRRSP